jgi:hypothetical protein
LWGAPVVNPEYGQGPPKDGVCALGTVSPYGSDAELLASLPGAEQGLATLPSTQLSEAMVRFAARYEYARTVEDVLARRNRLLFLDASAALAAAPQVAQILSTETGVSPQLAAFEALNSDFFDIFWPSVLTQSENVVISRASLVKKRSYLPKQKRCEWFAVWMTGPRLILVLQAIKL